MNREESFFKTVCAIAIPVTLQTMLQSSFSIVDQIMIGQLGSSNVAGVGMAGKFASIYSVVISAIGAVAGIMISQYLGKHDHEEVRRSFLINLFFGFGIAGLFTVLCFMFARPIMAFYTADPQTHQAAENYLRISSATFLPLAGSTLLATLYRCSDQPKLPLYASTAAALLNTGLNYVLIFGKLGFLPMGITGAAMATVISQFFNFGLMILMLRTQKSMLSNEHRHVTTGKGRFGWKQYLSMLMPVLVCEVVWSLGENGYAAIYGRMGTAASAAMTLTNPIQGLMTGALVGLSQAASVMIGKKLGNAEYDEAYSAACKLLRYGAVGATILALLVVATRSLYVEIYQVDAHVKMLTRQILLAYALVAPFKVLNMILGGGIIRSGGKTQYVMIIDMIGTWGFGIPLGLFSAFVLKLSIAPVYFMLSLEECVRFGISVFVLRRKNWMKQL